MKYEYIDEDATRENFKRLKALEIERRAINAELDAEQFGAAARDAMMKDDPNAVPQARHFGEEADRLRDTARKIHKHAGTSPDDFAEELLPELENRLQALEREHLHHSEIAMNNDVYNEPAGQSEKAAIVLAAGINAVRAKKEELEKAIKTRTTKTDN